MDHMPRVEDWGPSHSHWSPILLPGTNANHLPLGTHPEQATLPLPPDVLDESRAELEVCFRGWLLLPPTRVLRGNVVMVCRIPYLRGYAVVIEGSVSAHPVRVLGTHRVELVMSQGHVCQHGTEFEDLPCPEAIWPGEALLQDAERLLVDPKPARVARRKGAQGPREQMQRETGGGEGMLSTCTRFPCVWTPLASTTAAPICQHCA